MVLTKARLLKHDFTVHSLENTIFKGISEPLKLSWLKHEYWSTISPFTVQQALKILRDATLPREKTGCFGSEVQLEDQTWHEAALT